MNCNFIGNNTKLLLKYLNDGLGNGFYNVGISLVICSLAIVFSVCVTLLTLSIIKKLAEQEKEEKKKLKKQSEDQINYQRLNFTSERNKQV